jgi:hypothetical protein
MCKLNETCVGAGCKTPHCKKKEDGRGQKQTSSGVVSNYFSRDYDFARPIAGIPVLPRQPLLLHHPYNCTDERRIQFPPDWRHQRPEDLTRVFNVDDALGLCLEFLARVGLVTRVSAERGAG